jgi:DNA polymerase-3 subunit gamma/tau
VEHLALYREWRPQLFQDVIGQEHVSRTLRNAVRQGQVAHAYLFCGPRGTGKTSTARILAKAVNCPNSEGGEPCNTCDSCRNITAGISMDVIEMDAASHRGIEEIRDLNQKVCFAPTAGKSRLFIIDEVHMLTGEAFNALLKTLEEPPRHTIFVLATTEAHKVPLTIMSRCQRFDFRRLGRNAIREHLRRVAGEKGWQIDDDALESLSRHAGGAVRDALGLLEQAAGFTGGVIGRADLDALTGAVSPEGLRSLLAAAMMGDVPSLLQQLDEVSDGGCEARQVLHQLIDLVRERLFATDTPGHERTGYANLMRGLAAADADLKGNSRPDLVLEMALVRFSDALSAPAVAGAGAAVSGGVAVGSDGAGAVVAARGSGKPGTESVTAARNGAAAPDQAADAVHAAGGETAGEAAQDGQPPAEVNFVELRKILRQSFQKHPIEYQDVASCELAQDGDRIVLKASSAFQQERLQQDENRRRLLDAIRQLHPSLGMEIVCAVATSVRPGLRPAKVRESLQAPQGPQAAVPTSPHRDPPPATGGPSETPGIVQGHQDASPADDSPGEANLFDLIDREAAPDVNRLALSSEPATGQVLDHTQPPAPERQPGAEQAPARGRRPEKRQIEADQTDPVGVAITLFNGKLIQTKRSEVNETEAG